MIGPVAANGFVDPACPLDWTHPLNVGLVGDWTALPNPGWSGGLTLRDIVRGGHKPNDGTLTNFAMTSASGWTTGSDGGRSLAFDGSDDRVPTASGIKAQWTNLSISAWVNISTTSGDKVICGYRGPWYFQINTGSGTALQFTIFGVVDQVSSNASMAVNRWYHVAVTYNHVNIVFYVNGIQLSAHAQTGNFGATTGVLQLGALLNGVTQQNFFNGRIGGLTLHDRGLTAAEIQALYLETSRGNPNRFNWVTTRSIVVPAGGGPTAYTLTAAAGSFALAGQDAGVRATRTLAAGAGTFTETGNAAGLYRGLKTAADVGVFTLTGQAAGLSATRTITAAGGSFTLSGQAAGLLTGRRVTADVGSFALTGMAASLRLWRLAAGAGSFAVTGQSATLTYSGTAAGNAYYYQTFTSLGA